MMREPIDSALHLSEPTLAEVFIANRAQLLRVARRIVRTAELADDVVQDAYLKITDGPCVRKADRPIGYCCQVVRNVALDCCRRHTVEANYRTFDVDVEALDVAGAPTPDRLMRERQAIQAIDKVLAGLPARTRLVFELYRLEGLTQREIAQRLGCALGLVNGLIAEAAQAIKECGRLLEDD
ncbi:sigma-70 family RNA polymerase sigma factor [Variovorax paradoxus]|nr:sigma-70 family RNA polymerase sigma factor [Variovorax paradoxus]